jgi:HD-GYP domain-containing protein (c-di-GMP phosphodiesterase class II)
LAVLASSVVIVLPAVLMVAIVPRGSLLLMAISAASAMAISIAIAGVGAAVWKRQGRSRDVVFADLMLWNWLRRCWTERHLSQTRDLYDSARKVGPNVSIELLARLSGLLEARDAYTHGHSQRVARHSVRIARAMHLSPVEIAKIRMAATVHDVGKLYTPREILNNPGRLTDAEFAVVKRHSADGADMLATVGDPELVAIVRHHHERLDGHGYPDGLVGSEIPLGARIIAVADTFDAITSSRAYRSARTQKKALDILSKEAGSQLDRAAVAAFLNGYSTRRSIALLELAAMVPQRIVMGLQATSQSLAANAAGVASILPTLATASLLAVSPGLHPHTLGGRGASLQPALTRADRPTTPPISNTAASGRPASSGIHRSHRTTRITPSTGSRTPTTGTWKGPASAPSTNQPAAGTPAPTATSSPTPSSSTNLPPVNEAPTLPTPPSSPPLTLPKVDLPPALVPSVSIPSPASPSPEAPTTNPPSLG